jgi:hypothetical protein
MGNNRQFNFDLYVEELLTEALSLTQMQDQLRDANLDPAKYDQKHLLFLVGLINSNQDLEIYNDLLSKIKDKGLLNSLLSVSVSDRRSDKPTIDIEKVTKALQYAEDPNELKAIIAGQKKAMPAGTEELEYNIDELKQFLSSNRGISLFDILVKLKPQLDNRLKQFLNEYNDEDTEVQGFLKTNAQRAKTVEDLIAILHEGRTKNINPYNSTTDLTLEDLQNGAMFYNSEDHLYIIRTTYQDDFIKSIRANLKYGQGNRFKLCISSRNNNYYLDYRTGSIGRAPLTTYFVYKLYDKSLDPSDINNYQIAIIDAMGKIPESVHIVYKPRFSYNLVAAVVGRSQKHIHGKDELKWSFQNRDIPNKTSEQTLSDLDYMFDGSETVLGLNNNRYNIASDFEDIFAAIPLGRKEEDVKTLLRNFSKKRFFSYAPSEQIAMLSNDNIILNINKEIFLELSPEVRSQYVKIVDASYVEEKNIYELFNDSEKKQFNKRIFKKVSDRIEKITQDFDVYDIDYIINHAPISIFEYEIAIQDPKLRKIYVDDIQENNKKIRDSVLKRVDEDGVYKGNLSFSVGPNENHILTNGIFQPRYILPDLSDIIIDGDFHIDYNIWISLKGCPKIVTGTFQCADSNLTTLEGGPRWANKYHVFSNQLVSLKGAPEFANNFDARNNKLTNLEYCPIANGYLYLSNNNLISLKGCPEIMGGSFAIESNKLESLKGGPKIVNGYYTFQDNPLKSLEGYTFNIKGRMYSHTYEEYKNLFNAMGKDKKSLDEITRLTPEAESILQQHKDTVYNAMKQEFAKAKQEYKSGKQINRESLLYNLMKSFLLRS